MRLRPLLLALVAPVLALAQERVHVVRSGDTLPRLVFLYGVSEERIRAANGLTGSSLRPGTRLVIPGGDVPMDPPARRAEPVAVAPAEPVAVSTPEPVIREAPRATRVVETAPPTPAPAPVRKVVEEETSSRRASGRDFRDAIAFPASKNIPYSGRWTPPGESSPWVMDCSNTTRWLYREVLGIELPRTASDQYEWLRARRKLWKARADSRSLRKKLKPGDLLFWENTYKPVRKPPITHVMVYLGTDASGRMMMAGSQGSSGPDIYPFRPEQKMGGYRVFLFFKKDGRFVAYGRP